MNKNAKAWVKALRSGKYTQAKGYLAFRPEWEGEFRYCCLGVACELYKKSYPSFRVSIIDEKSMEGAKKLYGPGRKKEVLPYQVMRWLGLSENTGQYEDRDGFNELLTNLNDSGYSFNEIAKIIEDEPKGLFKNAS